LAAGAQPRLVYLSWNAPNDEAFAHLERPPQDPRLYPCERRYGSSASAIVREAQPADVRRPNAPTYKIVGARSTGLIHMDVDENTLSPTSPVADLLAQCPPIPPATRRSARWKQLFGPTVCGFQGFIPSGPDRARIVAEL